MGPPPLSQVNMSPSAGWCLICQHSNNVWDQECPLQVNMSGDCHDGGAGVVLPVTSCLEHDTDTSVISAVQYAHSFSLLILVIVCHYVAFLTKSWCWMIYNIPELCFDNFSRCCVMIIVGIIT